MKISIPLEDQLQATKDDLLSKLAREDYHGVRDACVDIEVLQAKIFILQAIAKIPPKVIIVPADQGNN